VTLRRSFPCIITSMTKPKRLAIIDGKSVFYRGYYAMPGLSMKDGTPTGGVYGFAALALELIKKLEPDYVAVAWDKPKTNIRRRKEIYPEYKAGRKPPPDDFYVQIPILHELLSAFGWPLYECDDYEADDIMGTLAIKAAKEGIETCLITGDLDMLQCVTPVTHVYIMKKGFTNIELYHPESFEERYGIKVSQFIDLKSLKGDSSDNIPGVPGIGEKTAIKLLQDYKTLDNIFVHTNELKGALKTKIEAGRDLAYVSKELAEIWCDAPVPLDLEAMNSQDLDVEELHKMLVHLEFKSLIKALPVHMQHQSQPGLFDNADSSSGVILSKIVLAKLDEASRSKIRSCDKLFVYLKDDDKLLVSCDENVAYELELTESTKVLFGCKIVAHDAKKILKKLVEAQNLASLPEVLHDTEQAAFLIDSLSRSRSLGELLDIDISDSLVALSSVRYLYNQQIIEFEKLPKVAEVAQTMDFPLISVLAKVESRGIGLDVNYLHEMDVELADQIKNIQTQIYNMVGYEFNIGSPAQLADILFGKLQLNTANIKRGKTGYSTGQKELDKLRGQHPIVELIEQFREYTKLQNTYIQTLPKSVDKNSRVHTTFRQDTAATGRLSSVDPNLQNIPVRTDLGRRIRTAFVPGKNNVFVGADYSQFELRLAAVLAGDRAMIETFNSDADIHIQTAAEVYNIKPEEVTKTQRSAAKTVNFGVLYGMSPHGLAAATGMTFGEAKSFINKYFESRAPLVEYISHLKKLAHDQGYVETLFGRRRPTPDVKSSNFIVREAAYRQAVNMPIQGTEADLMKLAMIKIENKLTEVKNAEMLLQIHDSVLVECRESDSKKVGEILKEIMQDIYPEIGVKLKVDVKVGKNWGEL
jgi:DNA polymerase-1